MSSREMPPAKIPFNSWVGAPVQLTAKAALAKERNTRIAKLRARVEQHKNSKNQKGPKI
jgi:hypothetical protein